MSDTKDSVRSLDLRKSFEENVDNFKSINFDRKMLPKSDNYWCFKALFANAQRESRGETYEKIDRYSNAPWNKKGEPMINVGSRVSDLINKYGVPVQSKIVGGIAKYWI